MDARLALQAAHAGLGQAGDADPRRWAASCRLSGIPIGRWQTRRAVNRIADVLRMHGPFEPHRLPLDDMEYTTMPQIMKKLEGRWAKV